MGNESTSAGAALLARVEVLGWPELGRARSGRPIRATRIGSGDAPPIILMAGIHGDEPASVEAVLAWLPEARPVRPIWVVPALNPDGLAANRKNNDADVDLNRNFGARNFVRDHAPGYDPGAAPLSEPETAAFAALVERARPAGVVAVHAPFACVNHDGPSAAWAEAVAVASGWPARASIGYPTPGSLGSWLGVDRGLPILTLELPPGPWDQFREPGLAALRAAMDWWLADNDKDADAARSR